MYTVCVGLEVRPLFALFVVRNVDCARVENTDVLRLVAVLDDEVNSTGDEDSKGLGDEDNKGDMPAADDEQDVEGDDDDVVDADDRREEQRDGSTDEGFTIIAVFSSNVESLCDELEPVSEPLPAQPSHTISVMPCSSASRPWSSSRLLLELQLL